VFIHPDQRRWWLECSNIEWMVCGKCQERIKYGERTDPSMEPWWQQVYNRTYNQGEVKQG